MGRSAHKRARRWNAGRVAAIVISIMCLASGCDPAATVGGAGPFNGRVIDDATGTPIVDAFIAFRWGGSSWIEGRSPHLLDVLDRTDAQGRFLIPWQGDKLSSIGLHGIQWSQEVWAPGYRRSQVNQSDSSGHAGSDGEWTVRLARVASFEDALDQKHRMDASTYAIVPKGRPMVDPQILQALAATLYADSYHRICEGDVPPNVSSRRLLELPHVEGDILRMLSGSTNSQNSEGWTAFYRKAGWVNESGPVASPPPLDRALLPELCTLSRVQSFQGNPA